MHEPLRQRLDFGHRVSVEQVTTPLHGAAIGPVERGWVVPQWLEPHQAEAAHRVLGSLQTFRAALLADAVGLGKTFVALALATRYRSAIAVVPASLKPQWVRTALQLELDVSVLTHESLSRGATVPPTSLIIVDEAHRFRNPDTRKYDRLARGIGRAHVLLITSTPVVNRGADLVSLLRLALPDHAFAPLGLSSLERATMSRAYREMAYATAAAIVARPAHAIADLRAALPAVRDGGIHRLPSVTEPILRSLIRRVAALEFPAFGEGHEAELLRLHLLVRLGSSATACQTTAQRHLAYLDRAISACSRSEALTRATARALFDTDDELQLALGDWGPRSMAADASVGRFLEERSRFEGILATLRAAGDSSPKQEQLHRILHRRADRKTLVFTTAVSTAQALARGMQWHQVAVVASGRAWIASGPIPVEEALTLFAPLARGASAPPARTRVSTLFATDFASEGLNLQDADTVVHYDLPWTPVRLEQRLGRIARLRSPHRVTNVWWFAPHPALEYCIGLERRLAEKARCQIGLGAPTTSRVGRARIINREFEQRERMGIATRNSMLLQPAFAVVQAARAAVIAVEWIRGGYATPELIALTGHPPVATRAFGEVRRLLEHLSRAADSRAEPPVALVNALAVLIRTRLADAHRGPIHAAGKRLARAVVRRGCIAGKHRDLGALDILDAVLDRLQGGVSVGAERALESLLRRDGATDRLRGWLARQAVAVRDGIRCRIVAAVFGDGSVASHGAGPAAVSEAGQSSTSLSTSSSSK